MSKSTETSPRGLPAFRRAAFEPLLTRVRERRRHIHPHCRYVNPKAP